MTRDEAVKDRYFTLHFPGNPGYSITFFLDAMTKKAAAAEMRRTVRSFRAMLEAVR